MSNGKTEENSHIEREMSTGKTKENSQIKKMGETESKKVKGTESRKVKGSVVLMKKNYVLCCKNIIASFIDRIYELLGKRVSMQLISSVHPDPENVLQGKLGTVAHLEKWVTTSTPLTAAETVFTISFDWDESMGVPEAFIIRNHHHSQFYLKTVTLEDVPGHGRVHFVCNSWVYPAHRYRYNRVFFSNKSYLPCQTPELLHKYREKELENLRGDESGELKEWDRVYDYAYYNDLGSPEKGKDHARPVLGGTKDYPYPRRGRTGRKPTKEDPCSESRLPLLSLDIYVPRDEQFGLLKFSDFLAYALKSLVQILLSKLTSLCHKNFNEFDSFQDVLKLYEGGIKLLRSTNVHEQMLQMWRRNFDVKIVPQLKMHPTFQHPSIQLFIMGSKPPERNTENTDQGSGQESDKVETSMEENDGRSSEEEKVTDSVGDLVEEGCELVKKLPNEKLNDFETRRYGSMAARLLRDVNIA